MLPETIARDLPPDVKETLESCEGDELGVFLFLVSVLY